MPTGSAKDWRGSGWMLCFDSGSDKRGLDKAGEAFRATVILSNQIRGNDKVRAPRVAEIWSYKKHIILRQKQTNKQPKNPPLLHSITPVLPGWFIQSITSIRWPFANTEWLSANKRKLMYPEKNTSDLCLNGWRHYLQQKEFAGTLEWWNSSQTQTSTLACKLWGILDRWCEQI